MIKNYGAKSAVFALLAITCMLGFTGCNSGTDGARSVEQPSKDEINKQIADLKSNTNIPQHFKDDTLRKLQSQLSTAK